MPQVVCIRSEVQAPLPDVSAIPGAERAVLEATRAKRLADLVTNQCKKALQHITSHKVRAAGGLGPSRLLGRFARGTLCSWGGTLCLVLD